MNNFFQLNTVQQNDYFQNSLKTKIEYCGQILSCGACLAFGFRLEVKICSRLKTIVTILFLVLLVAANKRVFKTEYRGVTGRFHIINRAISCQ